MEDAATVIDRQELLPAHGKPEVAESLVKEAMDSLCELSGLAKRVVDTKKQLEGLARYVVATYAWLASRVTVHQSSL